MISMKGFFSVTIKPTYACNLKCKYCYQQDIQKSRRESFMSLKVLEASISKLAKLPLDFIDLQWIGGETLLPGIDFFEYAVELSKSFSINNKKIINSIQTNATLLNDKWIDFLIRNKDWLILSISFDFFKEYFIKNQKMPQNKSLRQFNKIVDNILKLQKNEITFGTLVTINQQALEIPAKRWFEKWVDYDIKQIALQLDYNDVYGNKPYGKWKPYIKFLDEIFEEQYLYNHANRDKKILIRESKYLYNMLNNLSDLGLTEYSCHANPSLCSNYLWSIDTNGDIYTTCDAFVHSSRVEPSLLLAGNILTHDIATIMQSDRFTMLQNKQYFLRHSKICQNCTVYRFCGGGCPLFKSNSESLTEFSANNDYCQFMRHYYGYLIEHEQRERIRKTYE